MLQSVGRFLNTRSGSLAPILAVVLIPMVAVLGFSVDYTWAVSTKASMQNALDAAALSIMTLPKDMATADRQVKLQDAFAANAGQGAATLVGYTVDVDGTAHVKASASYGMPTSFMQIARVDTVQIGVSTAVNKTPALVEATFKVDKVSGWWDKTVTLYGKKFNETAVTKLMQISYAHNKFGDPKGYGTTTLSKITNNVATQVQKQVCTTKSVSNFNGAKAADIQETATNGQKWLITCTTDPVAGEGAKIDVKEMETLYLEMKIPNPNPGLSGGSLAKGTKTTLRSDDAATSDRLFIDKVKTKSNTIVDIFSAVPCSIPSSQAWEDGGSLTNNTIDDADFFYTVTGRCNFSQRISETVLTQ